MGSVLLLVGFFFSNNPTYVILLFSQISMFGEKKGGKTSLGIRSC